jgi:hypothetical protein
MTAYQKGFHVWKVHASCSSLRSLWLTLSCQKSFGFLFVCFCPSPEHAFQDSILLRLLCPTACSLTHSPVPVCKTLQCKMLGVKMERKWDRRLNLKVQLWPLENLYSNGDKTYLFISHTLFTNYTSSMNRNLPWLGVRMRSKIFPVHPSSQFLVTANDQSLQNSEKYRYECIIIRIPVRMNQPLWISTGRCNTEGSEIQFHSKNSCFRSTLHTGSDNK